MHLEQCGGVELLCTHDNMWQVSGIIAHLGDNMWRMPETTGFFSDKGNGVFFVRGRCERGGDIEHR